MDIWKLIFSILFGGSALICLFLIFSILECIRWETEWSKCKFYTISLGGFSLLVALIYCLL